MMDFKKVDDIIFRFCHEVLNEPLIFFSESDLQSLLYAKLYGSFGKLTDTFFQRGKDSKTFYKTIQLHREYGLNNSPKSRMDIVIFEKDDIKKINSPNLTIDKLYLEPAIGIEMGTHKISKFKEHLENDLRKLNDLKNLKRGYIIYILREETKSSSKSELGMNTVDRIKFKLFEPIIECSFPENIVPLIFLVRIQKKENLWGKCIHFNDAKKEWECINLTNIYQQLKLKATVLNSL